MNNSTALPLSGPAPLPVQFTDTTTGAPTNWTWDFGDGTNSTEQNPSHTYGAAGTYTVNLTVANAGVSDTVVKEGYVVVTEPVAGCEYPTGPYINFVIGNVSCPEENSGMWHEAVCTDNAMIRWALAGKSTRFYSSLLPWMWKRNLNCPDPGYSWAVSSPYNRPIYWAAVVNSDTEHVWYHHHAIDAEYLGAGDVSNSNWDEWKFFNYYDLNITIDQGSQIPRGTQESNTTVTIKNITDVYGCGQRDESDIISFTIDENDNVSPIPVSRYSQGYLLSDTGLSPLENKNIPNDLLNIVDFLQNNTQFSISKWEFDSKSNNLMIYIIDVKNQSAVEALQNNALGNYSIRMMDDAEFEIKRADLKSQLGDYKKDPAYQIASIGINTETINDPPEHYVEIWVYQSTPENRKLNNSTINGWRILVYPISSPHSEGD